MSNHDGIMQWLLLGNLIALFIACVLCAVNED